MPSFATSSRLDRSRASFFYEAHHWPAYFVLLLGVTRYFLISFTIFYFIPLFCFILPFSIGMFLVLVSTLVHELDHNGQTLPTLLHSTLVILSMILDDDYSWCKFSWDADRNLFFCKRLFIEVPFFIYSWVWTL